MVSKPAMYNHAPPGYICPFCLLVEGVADARVYSVQEDIVYRDVTVTAWVSSHQWPGCRGHVLVVPNRHYENIFDLPDPVALEVHRIARRVATAMKQAYGCEGISTRQHNEPAGNQDVWHYHLHVFPRYAGDNLYGTASALMPTPERAQYAAQLRAVLEAD